MNYVTSKDGTKIAYDLLGSGPVLIFITGAICHRNFKPVMDDAKCFSREFTVINYDRRGRGDSENNLPYAKDKEVEDIEALINSVEGKVFLYGHSSGAVLALEAALRLKNKIDKIFIYDPSYVHDTAQKNEYGQLVETVNSLITKKDYSGALRSFLTGIGMPKFFIFLLPLFPGWKKLKALAPTLAYDMDMTKDTPPLERLREISLPIKIAYGQKSPESIQSVSNSISKVISSSSLIEVEGQDHMITPKVLLPMFKDFFIANRI